MYIDLHEEFVSFSCLQPPAGLPRKSYVSLTSEEEVVIERILDNKLGEEAVEGQRSNLTTNRCEGSHLTILKSVPKSRVYRRNFAGRAHSANHSISVGETESVVQANRHLGAGNASSSPANRARKRQIEIQNYNKERKQSARFRMLKRACAERKKRFQISTNTGYSPGCDDPVVCCDHPYAR